MIHINSPRGLGDALHLRAIVLHLLSKGDEVTVYTQWPDVFDDLNVAILPADEAVQQPGLYSARACFQCLLPQVRSLSQFRNACLQAGVLDAVELNINWTVRNRALLDEVKDKASRPILLYQPLKRARSSHDALQRPDRSALRGLVNDRSDYFRVRIGHPDYAEDDADIACDLDLFGKTSVTDVIDLASICDLTVSEPSFVSVLAQCFDKRFVCLFSSVARHSEVKKVAGVTPARILEKPHLATVVYDLGR